MGEAKRRGTFEHRKKLAVQRDELIKAHRILARKEAESKMTPEQKQERISRNMLIATCMTMGSLYKISNY